MLRVIVELHPGGDETRKQNLGVIDIGNVSNLAEFSDYVVQARLKDFGDVRTVVREHERALGWRELVKRTLSAIDWAMHQNRYDL